MAYNPTHLAPILELMRTDLKVLAVSYFYQTKLCILIVFIP